MPTNQAQYAVDYPLAQLRADLLDYPLIDRVVSLEGAERRYVQDLWRELRAVASVQAWKSTTAICGQLLEASLKHRLTVERVPRSEMTGAAGTLGAVIGRARKLGIYSAPNPGLTVGGSVFTARQIRNMASHASPWERSPTEMRATLSIAALFCYLGHLFPTYLSPPADSADATAASDSGVWSPGHLVSRGRRTRGAGEREELRAQVVANFPLILFEAGRGSVRNVEELVVTLAQIGLRRSHSPVLAGVLPTDAEALTYLLARSPNRLARYMYMCIRADSDVFELTAGDKGNRLLAGHLSRCLTSRSMGIQNFANIIGSVPLAVRYPLLADQADELAAWAADATAADSVSLLSCFRRDLGTDGLTGCEATIARAVVARILSDPPDSVSPVALRAYQLRLWNGASGTDIASALVSRTPELPPVVAQRVLWDLFAFGAPSSAAVVLAAERCASADSFAPSNEALERASVIGLMRLAGSHREVDPIDGQAVAGLVVENWSVIDRFKLARIVIALGDSDATSALDPELRQRIVALLESITDVDGESRRLVARARRVLRQPDEGGRPRRRQRRASAT